MVPPVPTPEMRMSTLPSVSSQISGPVVCQVDGRVGGVVELLQNVAVGRLVQDLLGLGDGALHAVGSGREHDLRAVGQQRNAPLQAHGLRHGEDNFVALYRGHKGQRDAGVAAGGFDEHGFAGGDFARPSRRPRSWQSRCGLSRSTRGFGFPVWRRRLRAVRLPRGSTAPVECGRSIQLRSRQCAP